MGEKNNKTTTKKVLDQNFPELSVNTDQTLPTPTTGFLIDLTVGACRIILTVQRSAVHDQRIKEAILHLSMNKSRLFQLKSQVFSEQETVMKLFRLEVVSPVK